MKKIFKLGSALISLVLVLAIGWYVVFAGSAKPITNNVAELEQTLSEMGWVSPGISDEHVLYEISFRSCPACASFHKNEFPKLQAMGVDTRLFVFSLGPQRSKPKERAVIAELYKNRSWELAENWWAETNPGRFYANVKDIPDADGDPERTASIEHGIAQLDKIADILANNGFKSLATPILIWKNNKGQWKAGNGYNLIHNAQIRADIRPKN
ncbi:MAG TPA: hypothetical protein ENJ46_00955 [Hellea balneolensis]|uniref:Thioredoxin-like fold domain-containing protein n=1 Tax=Hellea balneolensis TaxID=287478 RepID=A0A7C3CBE1_9PROT|nr:hypothetical protein [Hellea balneolensis]